MQLGRPRSRRNITMSGNALVACEVASRFNESQREGSHQESQENLDEYDMPDIITTIHALGEAQKEILSEKPSDKDYMPKEKASQEESAAASANGHEKKPSFVT
ncbi:S ribonuclease [Pyrus ussuriensis x Pyrus communis]|uniref:S ribonuclease n=1 Tax=Pyrus ussuriensis x Pyrus communis TaxID=2448454 RepID=A0A5N5HW95_9ROSA|nr:S ribonuclease [Pyrus ussuriensis x Pyrus communis]KAB2631828.1 S ribonuclease [Pyrus ussuriensis x Pyrus communis]